MIEIGKFEFIAIVTSDTFNFDVKLSVDHS